MEFNGPVDFLHASGQILASQGDVILAPGNETIASGGGLVPRLDLQQNLGDAARRWSHIYGGGGSFTERPTVNGSGVMLVAEPMCAVIGFTPSDGTDFVVSHSMETDDFVWAMWRIDTTPIRSVLPENVAPSGGNHVHIQLKTAISGKIVLVACDPSGTVNTINNKYAQYGASTSGNPFTTTDTTAELDTTVVEDILSYTQSSGVVTVLKTGLYRISYSANVGQTSNNSRTIAKTWLARNGSTEIPFSEYYIYSRRILEGEGTAFNTVFAQLDEGDTVEIQGVRQTGGGVIQFTEGSHILIEFVRF